MEESFWVGLVMSLIAAGGSTAVADAVSKLLARSTKPSKEEAKAVEAEVGNAVEEAVASIDPQLAEHRPSEKGKAAAVAIMNAYMDELIAEAARVAKRAGSEEASDTHVEVAATRIGILRSTASAWSDACLAIGSLLVGGAFAYQINLWTGGTAKPESGLPIALALGVGIGLMATGLTLKGKRN